MHLPMSRINVAVPALLLGAALYFAATIGLAADVESLGFVSQNPSDLPPSLERDLSLRSTDPDRPPAYGPEDAKVLVVTFVDFQCPACRRASQSTHQIATEFPGDVRIEVWNNPLPTHRNADLAAAAALAAQRQGKFWEMSDILFQDPRHDMALIEQIAQRIGLDMERFRADLNDPAIAERIRQEAELAAALGAPATPGYVINGRVFAGWGSWASLRAKVERELTEANKLAAEGLDPAEIRNQRAIANNTDSATYELYRNKILLAENTAAE